MWRDVPNMFRVWSPRRGIAVSPLADFTPSPNTRESLEKKRTFLKRPLFRSRVMNYIPLKLLSLCALEKFVGEFRLFNGGNSGWEFWLEFCGKVSALPRRRAQKYREILWEIFGAFSVRDFIRSLGNGVRKNGVRNRCPYRRCGVDTEIPHRLFSLILLVCYRLGFRPPARKGITQRICRFRG